MGFCETHHCPWLHRSLISKEKVVVDLPFAQKNTKKNLTLLSPWQLHKHLHKPRPLPQLQLAQRTLLHLMHPRPFTSEIFSPTSQRHTSVTSSTKLAQFSPFAFAVMLSLVAHSATPTSTSALCRMLSGLWTP